MLPASFALLKLLLLGSLVHAQECDFDCVSGHGACSNGLCACTAAWTGDDCSISAHQSAQDPNQLQAPSKEHITPTVLPPPLITNQGPSATRGKEYVSEVLPAPSQSTKNFLPATRENFEQAENSNEQMNQKSSKVALSIMSHDLEVSTRSMLALFSKPSHAVPVAASRGPAEQVLENAPNSHATLPEPVGSPMQEPPVYVVAPNAREVTPHHDAQAMNLRAPSTAMSRQMARDQELLKTELHKLREMEPLLSDDSYNKPEPIRASSAIVTQKVANNHQELLREELHKIGDIVEELKPLISDGLQNRPEPVRVQASRTLTNQAPVAMVREHKDGLIVNGVTAVCIAAPLSVEALVFVCCALGAMLDCCLKSGKTLHEHGILAEDPKLKRKFRQSCGWNPCMCTKVLCHKNGIQWPTIFLLVVLVAIMNGGWILLCMSPMMHELLSQVALIVYLTFIIVFVFVIVFVEIWERVGVPAKARANDMIESNREMIEVLEYAFSAQIHAFKAGGKAVTKLGHEVGNIGAATVHGMKAGVGDGLHGVGSGIRGIGTGIRGVGDTITGGLLHHEDREHPVDAVS